MHCVHYVHYKLCNNSRCLEANDIIDVVVAFCTWESMSLEDQYHLPYSPSFCNCFVRSSMLSMRCSNLFIPSSMVSKLCSNFSMCTCMHFSAPKMVENLSRLKLSSNTRNERRRSYSSTTYHIGIEIV